MDDKLTAEILATCDSIGYRDGGDTTSTPTSTYFKGPSCLECIKDLVLYLRKDDDDHNVRRLLGKTQVLQMDLLPLIKFHASEDLELFDVLLRLIVNLTHPALLLYDEQVPKNKKYLSQYLEIEAYLRNYKDSFVDKQVWIKLGERFNHLIELDWDKRMEDDKIALERILVLIRNVLMVPSDEKEEKRTEDENSLHDRIIMVLHVSGVLDLLIQLGTKSDLKKEYCLHLLEILSLIFREQTGEQLAKTNLTRNEQDTTRDERELVKTLQKEQAQKALMNAKLPTRHSRFGGTFTVRNVTGPSGRELVCHKVISSTSDLSLDSMKKHKRIASNRIPVRDEEATRRSTIPVRIILKEFCFQLLAKCYNSFMGAVKDNIVRNKSQENDETYYLWGLKFFMEFNRFQGSHFSVSNVSATMSINTFHYIQTLLEKYHGAMVTDKENLIYWSKRGHTALRAYQELLFTLLWMDKCGSSTTREASSLIKSHVFYMPEYRELCLSLLTTYDPVKLSSSYLKDLIETNHLFMKMLEDYTKSNEGKIIVRTKGVMKRKKNKKTKEKSNKKPKRSPIPLDSEGLEQLWNSVCEEILSSVESVEGELPEMIPFDATLQVEVEDQWTLAIERIAYFLHTKRFREATSLLRAAREVWPTKESEFGESGMDPIDEALTLKNIYVNKDQVEKVEKKLQQEEQEQQELEREEEEEQDEENDEEQEQEEQDFEEEEPEERREYTSKETEFDFPAFSLKYATAKVISNYSRLFQDWEKLKPFTIHCIMKMFHRFVFDMNFPAILCQASIFRSFQKILSVADYQSDLKEPVKFFYHFWPKFVTLCERDKSGTMFVEILFWKSGKEAQEIQEGYTSYTSSYASNPRKKKEKKSRYAWTQDEIDQLELLAEQYKEQVPEEVRKSTKMVDYIKERWTYKRRSKAKFIEKLVEKGFLDPSTIKKRKTRNRRGESATETLEEPGSVESRRSSSRNSRGSDSEDDEERPTRDSDAEMEKEQTQKSTNEHENGNEGESDKSESLNVKSKSRIRKHSDADSSDDDEGDRDQNGEKSSISSSSPKSRMRIVDSDSDDDEDKENKEDESQKPRSKNRIVDSDSDDENATNANSNSDSEPSQTQKSSKLQTMGNDDDENEHELETLSTQTSTTNRSHSHTLDRDRDSDNENEVGKPPTSNGKPNRSRLLIVDSDDEQPQPTITSESEDSNQGTNAEQTQTPKVRSRLRIVDSDDSD